MSGGFVDGPVRVRVPATSANLGPGFDTLGLALAVHDELTGEVTGGGLDVRVTGEGQDAVARDETHLVVQAMRRTFARLGATPPGLSLECRNQIPHSRGLGSSAAAIVSGVVLARGLVADGSRLLDDNDALELAADIEGHPDNVAPCLLGGLTIAWQRDGRARALRRELDPAVVAVVLVPPFTASTELARGLLPASVAHGDAAFAAARAALLVAALTGAPDALFDATEDRLHQAYRAPAMPDSAWLVTSLRSDGHAAVISGAGPSVLVLARGQVEVDDVLAATPTGWTASAVPVDTDGAVLDPD